jgi:hypothetical protein
LNDDQLKSQANEGNRLSLPREQSPTSASPPAKDDAEQAMRRALGLHGDTPRSRPDYSEPAQRGGGFPQGVHRRRFVQDGEVPVTVVRRDSPEVSHSSPGPAGRTSSRLQRAEAALVAETAARERAERELHEARAAVRALETKIGHTDLAKTEALAASKHHLDESVALREELAADAERLRDTEARAVELEDVLGTARAELAEERRARKLADQLLREATEESARVAAPPPAASLPRPEVERPPARRGRPPKIQAEPGVEPEPVKWWLPSPKAATKRR